MFPTQQTITHAQQVEFLTKQLAELFVKKADAQAVIEDCDKQIVAIRNVLAGVQLGQGLQKEIDGAKAKEPAPVATE